MKCPACNSDTKLVSAVYLTAVRPRETRRCARCNRTFMVFDVADEAPLPVWQDERDPTISFSEFVEMKLQERQAVKKTF